MPVVLEESGVEAVDGLGAPPPTGRIRSHPTEGTPHSHPRPEASLRGEGGYRISSKLHESAEKGEEASGGSGGQKGRNERFAQEMPPLLSVPELEKSLRNRYNPKNFPLRGCGAPTREGWVGAGAPKQPFLHLF